MDLCTQFQNIYMTAVVKLSRRRQKALSIGSSPLSVSREPLYIQQPTITSSILQVNMYVPLAQRSDRTGIDSMCREHRARARRDICNTTLESYHDTLYSNIQSNIPVSRAIQCHRNPVWYRPGASKHRSGVYAAIRICGYNKVEPSKRSREAPSVRRKAQGEMGARFTRASQRGRSRGGPGGACPRRRARSRTAARACRSPPLRSRNSRSGQRLVWAVVGERRGLTGHGVLERADVPREGHGGDGEGLAVGERERLPL
ncbi:hypothetical protein C8Q73DRAFT_459110 [Cubamyces lactineus]|nr:hypothetical protein C8Q73DRAFT_459110 [Cubamyces lactineus]